jgi:anti-sigma factor RsiW
MEEDRLHAYVDRQDSPEERRVVEDELARDDGAAARVRAYAAQNQALHELFDPVLLEHHTIRVPRSDTARWRRWGGMAATLVVGIACGYLVRQWLDESAEMPPIAHVAIYAHAAYVPEVRHPVEVAASEQQHLVAWLSKRLSTPLRAPALDAAGYQLLGGRLLPPTDSSDPAPIAMLMYENAQGRRLSLLVKRESTNRETAFRFSEEGATRVFYWIDGPLGYALAGDLPRDELQVVARLVYRQLNP